MNTEITKIQDIAELQGWLLYDGECPYCCGWAARLEPALTRRGFDLAPLQSPWVRDCLDLQLAEPLTEMRLVTVNGNDYGGADAFLHLARHIWWLWPLVVASWIPGVKQLLRFAYRRLAERRHCLSGACKLATPRENLLRS